MCIRDSPNSVRILKLILQKLHCLEVYPTNTGALYLPNEKLKLVKNTMLLHDDQGRYKKACFNTNSLSYSFMSLLSDRREERSEYGFSLKEFVSRLPQSVRPLPLSVHCFERLSSGCTPQEQLLSELTTRLNQAFTFKDFAKVIQKILLASSVEVEICERYTESLTNFCSSVKVFSVLNLKVDVYLTLIQPPAYIGTTKVDFAFLSNTDSNSFVVYVNSLAKLTLKFLESFSHKLVSTVAALSDIDVGDLGEHAEEAVTTLLQDQSQDEIAELLEEYGASTEDFELHDSTYTVRLGSPIPDYLHHRLYADVHNVFRPQELVGYEITEDYYIFARVLYRIAESFETGDGELDKYCIAMSENDEDEKVVTIIELCKILRMKEIHKDNGSSCLLYTSDAADE